MMNQIALDILLAPLAVVLYGSGLLLWPLRRWLRRKQTVRGKSLTFVLIAQMVAYMTVACLSFCVHLQHFYDWFIFLIELNVLFTIAGLIAWGRDSRYERRTTARNIV